MHTPLPGASKVALKGISMKGKIPLLIMTTAARTCSKLQEVEA